MFFSSNKVNLMLFTFFSRNMLVSFHEIVNFTATVILSLPVHFSIY